MSAADEGAARRRHVPFAEAFRFRLKLGRISFGGPALYLFKLEVLRVVLAGGLLGLARVLLFG
jgi:hypothetical protein